MLTSHHWQFTDLVTLLDIVFVSISNKHMRSVNYQWKNEINKKQQNAALTFT